LTELSQKKRQGGTHGREDSASKKRDWGPNRPRKRPRRKTGRLYGAEGQIELSDRRGECRGGRQIPKRAKEPGQKNRPHTDGRASKKHTDSSCLLTQVEGIYSIRTTYHTKVTNHQGGTLEGERSAPKGGAQREVGKGPNL